jgi:hypothetical protein
MTSALAMSRHLLGITWVYLVPGTYLLYGSIRFYPVRYVPVIKFYRQNCSHNMMSKITLLSFPEKAPRPQWDPLPIHRRCQ